MQRPDTSRDQRPEYVDLLSKLEIANGTNATPSSALLKEIATSLEKAGFQLPPEGRVSNWNGDYFQGGYRTMTNGEAFKLNFDSYIEDLRSAIDNKVSIAVIQRRKQEGFHNQIQNLFPGKQKPR